MTELICYDDGRTKCFIAVPDGQGFPADEAVKVTCKKCIAALGAR
jgi:hypothetical protein